jgi:hypothetical protein
MQVFATRPQSGSDRPVTAAKNGPMPQTVTGLLTTCCTSGVSCVQQSAAQQHGITATLPTLTRLCCDMHLLDSQNERAANAHSPQALRKTMSYQ